MPREIIGWRFVVGPSPKGQGWMQVCSEGHVSAYAWGDVVPDPTPCGYCGCANTVWQPGYCPSTHGAAGPYEPICSFCGAEVRKEPIYA